MPESHRAGVSTTPPLPGPLHGPPAWSTTLAELDGWCLQLRCPACLFSTVLPCAGLCASHGPATLSAVLRRVRCRRCRTPAAELHLAIRPDAGAFGIPDHPWGFRLPIPAG